MRTGTVTTVTLASGANSNIIPYNANRKYLLIGSTSATAIQILPGTAIAVLNTGMRIGTGQSGIELRYEDIGDLVMQPVSIWNAGAAGTLLTYVEGIGDADY